MLTLHVDSVFSVVGFNNPCQMSLALGVLAFLVDLFAFAMLLPYLPFVGFHPDPLFPSGDASQVAADLLLRHSRTSIGHSAALI